MKLSRDFSAQILDLDGQPVRAPMTVERMARALATVMSSLTEDAQKAIAKAISDEAGAPLTLGAAASASLIGSYPDESGLTTVERTDRFMLAMRVHKGGMQEIGTEERDKIKLLVGKQWLGSLVAPRAWALLETDPPA